MENNYPQTANGRKWHHVRRFVHVLLSIAALYYWFPDPLVPGFPKWYLLVIGLAIIAILEILRFRKRVKLPWTRPYEEGRVAAHSYAALGATIVLILAPPIIGAPAIVGMACADPVAGELRHHKRPGWLVRLTTGIVYGLIAFTIMMLISSDFPVVLLLTIIKSIVAVISENPDYRYFDDDFTMIAFPALAGYVTLALMLMTQV